MQEIIDRRIAKLNVKPDANPSDQVVAVVAQGETNEAQQTGAFACTTSPGPTPW
jgi:hypothetical protein